MKEISPVGITKRYIKEVDITEIDIVNQDQILGPDPECERDHERITIPNKKASWAGEAEPVEIGKMIDTLTRLRDLGSTHVEIMHHEDHHGYYVNGLEMRKSTPEELADLRDKTAKQEEKHREIAELEKKIEKIKKS